MKMPDEEDLKHFPGFVNFPGVRLWKVCICDGDNPLNGESYIADWRSYDIQQTMVSGIRNARPGCVAFTFCDRIKLICGRILEEEAASRGAIVLWWGGRR